MPANDNTQDQPDAEPLTATHAGEQLTRTQTSSSANGSAHTIDYPAVPGYEILGIVGEGGMGIVYRARDLAVERDVAIKLLQPRYSLDSPGTRRFIEESRITAQLQHPAIPPVHFVGTLPDGRPFLAMKLIKGDTFADLLNMPADVSSRSRFVAVFLRVCQALAYAHSRKVIHRDLKPHNVMVGAFGEVQVMDWGLAKVLRGDREPEPEEHDAEAEARTEVRTQREPDSATQAGSVLGTPAYMSPEQAQGAIHEIDERSDVFGLGAMLCAILTGKPPYSGSTSDSVRLKAIRGDTADALARLDACGADADLIAITKRCLGVDRNSRYRDAGEVAAVVASHLTAVEERAKQAELERARTEERRKKRRVQWALAGAVLLLALAGTFATVVTTLWRTAETAKSEAEIARDAAEDAKAAAIEAQQGEEAARKEVEREREKLAALEYGRTIQVAHQAWREGNEEFARKLLEKTDSKRRGWEWHFVNHCAHCGLLNTLHFQTEVLSVSCNPDATQIAIASGNVVSIREASNYRQLFTLAGHTNWVYSVQYSPDGTKLVTASLDGTARIWSAKTGTEIALLAGHTDKVWSAEFSSDGKQVITASSDCTARIWNVYTGMEIQTIVGHTATVSHATFSPCGDRVSTSSMDNTVRIWDPKTSQLFATLQHESSVYFARYNHDASKIVAGCFSGEVVLWNIQHETQLSILTGHQSRVLTGQFSKDGSKILTGSSDRTAILWEAETGQKLQILKGHIDDVRCVLFNPDETRLITTSDDTQVKLWDREFGSRRYVDRNSITFLAVRAAEFHPDGSTIVICESGEVSVYDLKSNKTLHRLNWAWSACEFVKFSDDGTRFYAQNSCNTKIWNAQTGAEIFTHENDGFLNLGLLSPTNDTILTIEDKTAVLWDIIGTQRLVLTGHSSVINSAVFSPNGQHVLTASDDETAILWNAQTGTIVFTLSEHTHKVKHALFTPDGSRIITVSADMSIKFWDSLSGAAVLTIKEVERTLLTATFSRDGSTLFAGGYGGTATLLTAGPSYKAVAPPPRPKP